MQNDQDLKKLIEICSQKDIVKFNQELIKDLQLELVDVLEVGLRFMDDFKQDVETSNDINYIASMNMHFFLAGYLMATSAYNENFSKEMKNKLN